MNLMNNFNEIVTNCLLPDKVMERFVRIEPRIYNLINKDI